MQYILFLFKHTFENDRIALAWYLQDCGRSLIKRMSDFCLLLFTHGGRVALHLLRSPGMFSLVSSQEGPVLRPAQAGAENAWETLGGPNTPFLPSLLIRNPLDVLWQVSKHQAFKLPPKFAH